MREIKFRVFEAERMIHINKESSYTLSFGNEKPILSMFSNGGEFVCEGPVDNLMQYTGLKDKNGIEIYEGDIVSSDYYLPEIKSIAAIKFANGRFVADSYEQDAYIYGNIQVAGNIHENPDLLDGKQ